MKQSIKNTYYDALYFASADFNKKKSFYLSPSDFKVIIKLIHYGDTYADITFQNKDIAKHTFLAESTVKDICESLRRKNYITSQRDIFNNRLGYASKRTIIINWDMIQSIDDMINEVPAAPVPAPVAEVVEAPIQQEPASDDILSEVHLALTEVYNDRGKYSAGRSITPAEFHNLTNNHFKELPFIEFYEVYKKHKTETVEGFLQLFDELNNLKEIA